MSFPLSLSLLSTAAGLSALAPSSLPPASAEAAAAALAVARALFQAQAAAFPRGPKAPAALLALEGAEALPLPSLFPLALGAKRAALLLDKALAGKKAGEAKALADRLAPPHRLALALAKAEEARARTSLQGPAAALPKLALALEVAQVWAGLSPEERAARTAEVRPAPAGDDGAAALASSLAGLALAEAAQAKAEEAFKAALEAAPALPTAEEEAEAAEFAKIKGEAAARKAKRAARKSKTA